MTKEIRMSDSDHVRYKRRALFVQGIASPKYGMQALRALATAHLDIDAIGQMTDEQLLRLPGIGPKALAGIRDLYHGYLNPDGRRIKEKGPGKSEAP
jgi:hypothetical protein